MNQRFRAAVFLTLVSGLGGFGRGVHAQYRGPIVVPAPLPSPQPFTPPPMIPTPSLKPSFPTVGSPPVVSAPTPAAPGRLSGYERSRTPPPEEYEEPPTTHQEKYEQPRTTSGETEREEEGPIRLPPRSPASTPSPGSAPVTSTESSGGSRTSWLVGLGCVAVVAYLLGRRRAS